MLKLLATTVVILAINGPAGASEPTLEQGIMGDWEAKPFTWQTGAVKGCRYRQIINIQRKIGPGRFVGTYKARTSCVSKSWNLRGNITVTVQGKDVTINADTRHWITERVKYRNSYLMEGKDAQGHPMIYVRPKSLPNS